MKIRSKLAWTFILLLAFGILMISSYSILFIRNYLKSEQLSKLSRDAQWMALTIEQLHGEKPFRAELAQLANTSGYNLAVFDDKGALLSVYPDSIRDEAMVGIQDSIMQNLRSSPYTDEVIQRERSPKIYAYTTVRSAQNRARYLELSLSEERIEKPIKQIRYIIYSGMGISIILVIIVSVLFSRYISRPITQLKDAALEIAGGDTQRTIDIQRSDEFGTLASSLNKMASKLRADNEKLKNINERQRQFFADITHEVRNPLHTIMGSMEMLQLDKLPDEKRQKYVRSTLGQAERVNRLFKDLMTLQRYDSDEYFIQKKQFDLGRIALHMEDWYQDRAQEKGLIFYTDQHECYALGDPDKIEQVIDNLVSNAIKYTNEGKVWLRYHKNEDGNVIISVRDTGIGIAEEHLDRLYDRFYRTDKARSREKGGTGLGLSVVKSILNAHDTDIEVKSVPGEGSTFTFVLPSA